MLQQSLEKNPQRIRALHYSFARTQGEVMEAQRLRYKVFAEEMGARLPGHNGLDRDGYDAFSEHLLVRDADSGKVVGTYRILDPQMALEAGGYYAEGEFDLTRILHLAPVELGRACVHRDYRNGAVIGLLWAGLAQFMRRNGYQHVIGSASIPMTDGGRTAANLYTRLAAKHLAPQDYRVFAHCPLPVAALADEEVAAACPPLLKGYLRLGASLCGEPHWDADFNCADLLVLLPMSRLADRYRAHFMR
jgi:putative hemolysin